MVQNAAAFPVFKKPADGAVPPVSSPPKVTLTPPAVAVPPVALGVQVPVDAAPAGALKRLSDTSMLAAAMAQERKAEMVLRVKAVPLGRPP